MEIVSKIRTRYLWMVTLLFLIILSLNTFAGPQSAPPGLTEVLQGKNPAWNWGFLMVGLFALSLATLSFAKSLEIFKRGQNSKEENRTGSEMDILKEENNRLLSFNHNLHQENESIKKRLRGAEESLSERSKQEEVLMRNFNSLKREYEKILGEREKLTLDLNSAQQDNWLKLQPVKKEKKARAANKTSPKKKVKRKKR
jgi:hypothetical protein